MKIQKKCKVKGCATAAYCKGMCNRHYKYFYSHGYVKEITVNDNNKIDVRGTVARIHLRNHQGQTTKFALIDSGDVKLARKYIWKADNAAVLAKGVINGEKYHVTLARLVLGLKDRALVVMHVNDDMLDCRRNNLKAVDREWMLQNSKTPNTNTSGHRGVSWRGGKWHAYIHHGGKKYTGGAHRNLEDAILARKMLEKEYFRGDADMAGGSLPGLKTLIHVLSYPEKQKKHRPMARVKNSETWKTALRELLDGNLLTQKELGDMCGVSAQSVSNWMNDVRNPGIFAKRKIVKIIRETGSQMKRNHNLLDSLLPARNPDSDKKQLEKMLRGMTAEQIRKFIETDGKIAG